MDFNDSMGAIAIIAERRIQEAMAEGQFDDLPGRGKPQKLEDLSHLPPEVRMVYTILKNSGYLEAEGMDKSSFNMPGLLFQSAEEGRSCGKIEKLKFMLSRSRRLSGRSAGPAGDDADIDSLDAAYVDKLLDKV